MMFGVGIISGVTVGIEFFWDIATVIISVGIIRISWCWDLETYVGDDDE
jgi:hypothetical protein